MAISTKGLWHEVGQPSGSDHGLSRPGALMPAIFGYGRESDAFDGCATPSGSTVPYPAGTFALQIAYDLIFGY